MNFGGFMIKIKHRGNFNKLEKFLARMAKKEYLNVLDKFGQEGVEALSKATPIDSGETSSKWGYTIEIGLGQTGIYWHNSNENKGVNIAIILQYGHGTNNGGFVQGIDYINPAMAPIFEAMAEAAWKEVTK